MLILVPVGDEQIAIGTVAAGLIQRHWLHRVHMDEQRELALPGLVSALRATRKPHGLIWIEEKR
jgi:hypothetical protein